MFNEKFAGKIAGGQGSESNNDYKESRDNDLDQETPDLSREPDLGHLAADKVLEERDLERLNLEHEGDQIRRMDEIREEDRRELTRTYRRPIRRSQKKVLN